jgi:hypothetical protein
VGADLVNLATHHPSGCEVICVGPGGAAADCLPAVVAELVQRYDAVMVDGGVGDRQALDLMVEHGDALLLVGLPSSGQVGPAGRWIERLWALGLGERTALVLNRVTADQMPPRELELAFPYGAQLPDDPAVEAMGSEGPPLEPGPPPGRVAAAGGACGAAPASPGCGERRMRPEASDLLAILALLTLAALLIPKCGPNTILPRFRAVVRGDRRHVLRPPVGSGPLADQLPVRWLQIIRREASRAVVLGIPLQVVSLLAEWPSARRYADRLAA